MLAEFKTMYMYILRRSPNATNLPTGETKRKVIENEIVSKDQQRMNTKEPLVHQSA